MAPKNVEEKITKKNDYNKGAWTTEEDEKLRHYTQIHGPKRWKTLAINAGLNKCAKSCRLRWLNYLKPGIKRGNISEDEEDLIIRLHKLLGNRWTLIDGRLPGRTDNEIKNYWNSCLSKKINKQKVTLNTLFTPKAKIMASTPITVRETVRKVQQEFTPTKETTQRELVATRGDEIESNNDTVSAFDPNDFFDFSFERVFGLDWMNNFFHRNE